MKIDSEQWQASKGTTIDERGRSPKFKKNTAALQFMFSSTEPPSNQRDSKSVLIFHCTYDTKLLSL
jgi:hypothetical protein